MSRKNIRDAADDGNPVDEEEDKYLIKQSDCKSPDLTGTNSVCENWLNMQQFILKNTNEKSPQFPNATLCPYPDDLFSLDKSDCADSDGYFRNFEAFPTKKNFVKILGGSSFGLDFSQPPVWDDKCTQNPYKCLSNLYTNLDQKMTGKDDYLVCRKLHGEGKYCSTKAGSLTANRRAAAWGCGIGSVIGMGDIGQCSQKNYNYEGIKDWIRYIGEISPQFESLSYLCMGTQISAFQCKLLDNFKTQDIVYKSLLLEEEKLLNAELEQPTITTTMSFAILATIIVFLIFTKTFVK